MRDLSLVMQMQQITLDALQFSWQCSDKIDWEDSQHEDDELYKKFLYINFKPLIFWLNGGLWSNRFVQT